MAKIGCSTYSFRKSFKEKKYSWDDWSLLKQKFPEIQGFEVLSDDCAKYLKGIDEKNLQDLKSRLNTRQLEWFAATTDGFDFGTNPVPFWVDHESYIKGFEIMNQNKVMGAEEWIEYAGSLGVPMMRIDVGQIIMNHKIPYSHALDFNTTRLIEFYRECCRMSKEYNIRIGFENHGGFASDRKVIERLLNGVPELHLTLDTGNLPDKERYDIINQFADRINFIHAKTYVFDDQGNEKYIDFSKIGAIMKDHGFNGWYSIEFEGPGEEDIGVRKTIDLLKRII
jgi:sugar phosphate isomerase/epimerase